MTVADNTSRNQYTATPSQALFAYTFEIVDKDDIVVLINGTPLSEGTDYTVTGVGSDAGGNIVLTSGTTGGNIVTIYRDMAYERTQNYTNSGDFLASEVNSDFDRLWLAGEQTDRAFEQSIRKPITDSDSISMELPEAATRATKFLKFDANGAVDIAAGVTTDVDADDVSIVDAGGYYTSDNVEGALQEIGAQPPGFDPNTDSFNIGSDAVSSGTDSIALGHYASATDARDIALGYDAVASGGGSIAIGQETDSTGVRSIAVGKGAQSTLSTSIAIGEDASTLGGAGGSPVAIGYSALSTGISGISLGGNATASGDYSTALGHDTNSLAVNTIAIGFEAYSSVINAIAIGTSSRAEAYGAVSIGTDSDASREGSVALGRAAQATGAGFPIAIGYGSTTFGGLGSPLAIGYQANTTGAYGVGIGYQTVTSGAQGIAIGYIAKVTNDNSIAIGRQLTVAGQKAIGIGWGAVAGAYDSIGIGTTANALNTDSISIGATSNALASGAVAIGGGATTSNLNIKGVAVGYAAQANDMGGVSIGNNAVVGGAFGVALGRDSLATGGSYATALGYNTEARVRSTAVGSNSEATGDSSISMGYDSSASSDDSIAIGKSAEALGIDAIALGNLAGADAENTIHINASGVDTNQPQTAGHIVIETDDAALKYDGSWSLTGGAFDLTGDLNFGDNDKVTFGTGADLQLYHNGNNSFIEDTGTGSLYVRASDALRIQTADSQNMIKAEAGGAITLFDNNISRLATTSTGIDVTGTATMDGLDVQGNVIINNSSAYQIGGDSASTSIIGKMHNSSGMFTLASLDSRHMKLTTSNADRLKVGSNGDISFYEDTGTTAKFFWDASAESLGIGTSSPKTQLDIATGTGSAAGPELTLTNGYAGLTTGDRVGAINFYTSDASSRGPNNSAVIEAQAATTLGHDADLVFKTGVPSSEGQDAVETMRIDSNGRVGIGTDGTVYSDLQVHKTSGAKLWITADGGNPSDAGSLRFAEVQDGNNYFEFLHDGSNNKLKLTSSNGDLVTFDRINQRVGIGSFSPPYKLTIAEGNTDIGLVPDGANGSYIRTGGSDPNSSVLRFLRAGNAEAMRITNGGHLLVGKTAQDSTNTVGFEAKDNGLTIATTDGGQSLILNRKTSDGTIAEFRKDNTIVGSIGTAGGSLDIGSGDTTLRFNSGLDAIYTVASVGGGGRDGAVDLGVSSQRFKDIWLSGDVYATNIKGQHDNNTKIEFMGSDETRFVQGGAEKARLNSSGTLLVGKSASAFTAAGHEISADGLLVSTRDSGNVAVLNRETNDGSILQLRKDNSTIGSIGTHTITSSSRLYVGSGDVNLMFRPDIEVIQPASDTGLRDAAISLGNASGRFKDLYLSGGAYLGGSAAANKLDDYEEGTFTLTTQSDPTGTLTAGGGNYVKVGQQVFIEGAFQVGVNFTNNSVGGLPFTVANSTGVGSSVRPLFVIDDTGTGKFLRLGNGGSTLQLFDSSGAVDAPDTTGDTYRFMGSYRTTA